MRDGISHSPAENIREARETCPECGWERDNTGRGKHVCHPLPERTSETMDSCLRGMLAADPVLYDRCLDTVGFAYYFNRLALLVRDGEDEIEHLRADRDRLVKALGEEK